jgi:endonuclease YncB( thermonuclease family)
MVKVVAATLLVALGYVLGASGVVPQVWQELLGRSTAQTTPTRAVAPPVAPEPSEAGAVPATPNPAVAIDYSYSRPPAEQLVQARVVSITDGDTFRALIGNQNVPIRMADYDSPERDQPYGREATAELTKLLADGAVQLEVRGSGGFGRTAARVFVGDGDVNFEMVRRGGGWFDPEYAKDEELYIVENAARDAKVGLWALPLEKRIEPWEWRKLSKEQRAARR